ncbi:RMD1 family protein [Bradyrhizobium sp. U87765 SZCCT0131]|uniref:RMD1 family protein n=1 Tax=unclassified Bradyrhizobium TaxID=2631580 RepID=UPI001BA5A9DA|nr:MULTISPECIES: RMD1 family protein [unclassified Bradyrhizobium]MBR1222353.1 RMD1 family protein [Bradyrhizobium sp. U87765 SZCCT0131]MBR1264163.1 RMD1 family protein [Bradyrhizobium sp. U87765 SZCCT0134]MBR1308054.1 RMD1 family protein [Bradyrhizobium sp. U87765 SZCCT0110]MBR1320413.1 RMD1 family protein [Bradyrhizobium sp. U87765 SZCCT0109]MBR1348474.1 RMD1 family protein [Bradyrhizobium sp. U87765 SZCCT0048]
MTAAPSSPIGRRLSVRALLVGDRLNASGFEARDMISTTPVAFRVQNDGMAVLFRYGVVVLIGLTPDEQAGFLSALKPRIISEFVRYEEEATEVELGDDPGDVVPPGGPIRIASLSNDRLLLVADALAKSTVLAHDERRVAAVFDVIEPFARELAERGRTPHDRTAMLKLIGNALLVQQRVSGRVAVTEKPDALWDKPELERLYTRLEDEYELQERVEALDRKLTVIAETAQALTDMIDTRRTLRLEWAIVGLISFEIVLTLYQLFVGRGH